MAVNRTNSKRTPTAPTLCTRELIEAACRLGPGFAYKRSAESIALGCRICQRTFLLSLVLKCRQDAVGHERERSKPQHCNDQGALRPTTAQAVLVASDVGTAGGYLRIETHATSFFVDFLGAFAS